MKNIHRLKNKQTYKLMKTKRLFTMFCFLCSLVAVGFTVTNGIDFSSLFMDGITFAMLGAGVYNPGTLAGKAIHRRLPGVSDATPSNLKIPGTEYLLTTQTGFDSSNTTVIPNEVVVGVNSAAGGGAAITTVSLFNQDLLLNVTDNGSGAGSITYNYLDGFAGRLISEVISRARAAVGQIIYGYSITFTVASTGANFASALNSCNPNWTDTNCYGNTVPFNASAAVNHSRGDFDQSIAVIEQLKNAARWSQFNLSMAIDSNASVCFYTHPGFKV